MKMPLLPKNFIRPGQIFWMELNGKQMKSWQKLILAKMDLKTQKDFKEFMKKEQAA